MASIKDLKKRIGTVKNTQQTTRAMKMVSAAKLRRAQDAIIQQRPYAQQVAQLIEDLSQVFSEDRPIPSSFIRLTRSAQELARGVDGEGQAQAQAQELNRELGGEGEEERKILLLVLTSDRGLCGAFNSNVIKASQKWLGQLSASERQRTKLAFIGRKGHDFFKHRSQVIEAYLPELAGKVTFQKARELARFLTERFLSGEVTEVKIVYNEFKNAATQRVIIEDFLPIRPGGVRDGEERSIQDVSPSQKAYLIKPSPEILLQELLSKNFSIQAFRILLESQAGEHGARMAAMENASKNAGEMMKKLALQYNKQRQAGITKELLEIISGSESQKS